MFLRIRNPDQDLVETTMAELGLLYNHRERHPNTLSGGRSNGWLWQSA